MFVFNFTHPSGYHSCRRNPPGSIGQTRDTAVLCVCVCVCVCVCDGGGVQGNDLEKQHMKGF